MPRKRRRRARFKASDSLPGEARGRRGPTARGEEVEAQQEALARQAAESKEASVPTEEGGPEL